MNDRQSDSTVTRRGFFQRAGVVAVTVSVPAWVWGCGSSQAAEPVAQSSSGGETAAASHTMGASNPSGGVGESASGSAVNDETRAQVAAFEAETVYTASAPGQWDGKAGSHVPQVTFRPGSVELFTNHGMSPEHWISAQYVKDQDGNLIAFAAHGGTDAEVII